MEFVISGFPRSISAAEYDTVSLVKKHLRRAAGMPIRVVRQALVDHADVADSRSNVGQPPRRPRLGFVVEPSCEIPSDRCGVLCFAEWVASFVEISVWRE